LGIGSKRMMMMKLLRVGFSREILCMISQYTRRSATTLARLSQRLSFMFVVTIRHDVHQSRNAYKKTIAKQIRRYATSPETSPKPKLQHPNLPPSPSPLSGNRKVKRSSIRTEHERKNEGPGDLAGDQSGQKVCVLTRLLWSRTFRNLAAGSW
jgi:hypothetical protein